MNNVKPQTSTVISPYFGEVGTFEKHQSSQKPPIGIDLDEQDGCNSSEESEPLQAEFSEELALKWSKGLPLNMKEMGSVLGYSYSAVRNFKRNGMPVFYGKVFPEDFALWRRQKLGLVPQQPFGRPQHSSAGKYGR